RWDRLRASLPLPQLARAILADSVSATLTDDARGRFGRGLVARLLARIDAFAARDPLATLDDFLNDCERRSQAGLETGVLERVDENAVAVLDVEAAKGREFDVVALGGVRAGSWPRYYVADAFSYLPSLGVVPKENVGEAQVARTAKYTFTCARYRWRDKFIEEERRALYCAASRARKQLIVASNGKPTQGKAAPELFEELRMRL
ncbi:MAG: 3'-5' exonuclease, partial [Vulcanimicrobiaceae bacterium]